MSEMIFLMPNAFLFFILPLLIALFLYAIWQSKKRVKGMIGSEELCRKIGYFPSSGWYAARSISLVWAAALLVIALSGPAGNPHYAEERESNNQRKILKVEHEVIFFIDDSSSMLVDDMRQKKSRLSVAKEIADEVIKGLRGETVSVYVFSSDVEKQVPPTVDYLYARLVLRGLKGNDMGGGGTDLAKAFSAIAKDFSNPKKGKRTTLIFLSDGEDTEGAFAQAIPGFSKVKNEGIDFFFVGLGTPQGGLVPEVMYQGRSVRSKREDAGMQKLAEILKGSYIVADSSSPLLIARKLLRDIERKSLKRTPGQGESLSTDKAPLRYDAYFQYFLLAGIAFFILFLTLPQISLGRISVDAD